MASSVRTALVIVRPSTVISASSTWFGNGTVSNHPPSRASNKEDADIM
jgi:hypothetical protein